MQCALAIHIVIYIVIYIVALKVGYGISIGTAHLGNQYSALSN